MSLETFGTASANQAKNLCSGALKTTIICTLNKHDVHKKGADMYHSTIVGMKEIHNFLGVVMPKVNIAAVAAADDELTARTIEVNALHYKHTTTARLFLTCIQQTGLALTHSSCDMLLWPNSMPATCISAVISLYHYHYQHDLQFIIQLPVINHWHRQLRGTRTRAPLDFQLYGWDMCLLFCCFRFNITQTHCRRRFTFHT